MESPRLSENISTQIPKKSFLKTFRHFLKKYFFSKESFLFILLTILSAFVLSRYVDLTPSVGEDFFFSSDDPHYQADTQISKTFKRKDIQIIISVGGDIFSSEYQKKIKHLSELLVTIEGIAGVKSLTHGPQDIFNARQSPFWRRLLISKDNRSSNVMIFIKNFNDVKVIRRVEALATSLNDPNFRLKISGSPYISELIRRNLLNDLKTFSTLAFALFGLMVVLVFHSWRIFIGMVVCCLNAASLTFMLSQILNIKVGLLTANLATITFVLTLSHIVFLTFNWKNIYKMNSFDGHAVDRAVEITRWASFWCMFTTLLGFISLLFVPAQPLRELGISGSLATAIAFIIVYSMYPAFLRLEEAEYVESDASLKNFYEKSFAFVGKLHTPVVILIMGIIIVTIAKLWELNTDPSLLSYFSEQSEIREGLEYIDQTGGSNPLVIVIQSNSGELLNTSHAYKKLLDLQNALEQHPSVGTIISIPSLMAEARRAPLSFLFSWERLIQMLEKPQYDRIAESFISKDRRQGLYLIRMKEFGREKSRLEIIEELNRIVEAHGFRPSLVGGNYTLQGKLSKLVAESLVYSLGRLISIFAIIAFIFGRSLRISLAMTLSISIIPLCILGIIGYFKIPLDIICAPAANVALGMGIDNMIHMVNIFHRSYRKEETNTQHWAYVTKRMWHPIITSMLIICAGFGIFFFSSFPPTQRFGGSIVFGSMVAAFTALFIFPLLAKQK